MELAKLSYYDKLNYSDKVVQQLLSSDYSEGRAEIEEFLSAIAFKYLGFHDGYGYYNSGTFNLEFNEFIDELSMDSDDEDHFFYEDDSLFAAKEEFGFKLMGIIKENDLQVVDGFDDLFTLAQNVIKFNASRNEFEEILKNSSIFQEMAYSINVQYNNFD